MVWTNHLNRVASRILSANTRFVSRGSHHYNSTSRNRSRSQFPRLLPSMFCHVSLLTAPEQCLHTEFPQPCQHTDEFKDQFEDEGDIENHVEEDHQMRTTPIVQVCGADLFYEHQSSRKPIRRFAFHDLHSWLARLYSRAGVEDALEATAKNPPCRQRDGRNIRYPRIACLAGIPWSQWPTIYIRLGQHNFCHVHGWHQSVRQSSSRETRFCYIRHNGCLSLPVELAIAPKIYSLLESLLAPKSPRLSKLTGFCDQWLNSSSRCGALALIYRKPINTLKVD
ncbi:hypothetical protein PCASD_00925 [Puccinia coronata f. sp. avenae]|uniref:Uncharacterized protein n=1 Tax=Puccinia coronata f. sp. avenae TaxID=200324 RepID=A0A2N5VPG5_9BASI|nr:hypothetical protein PCASD_00925 [Puccinia coronata f. sp. avenae]